MNYTLEECTVYHTTEESGRAWAYAAHSGAVDFWDLVDDFLVACFKQQNLLTHQVGIHACQQ